MKYLIIPIVAAAIVITSLHGVAAADVYPEYSPTEPATPGATVTPTAESSMSPTPEATETPTIEWTMPPTPEATETATVEWTMPPTPEVTATPTIEMTPPPTETPIVATTATPAPSLTSTPTPTFGSCQIGAPVTSFAQAYSIPGIGTYSVPVEVKKRSVQTIFGTPTTTDTKATGDVTTNYEGSTGEETMKSTFTYEKPPTCPGANSSFSAKYQKFRYKTQFFTTESNLEDALDEIALQKVKEDISGDSYSKTSVRTYEARTELISSKVVAMARVYTIRDRTADLGDLNDPADDVTYTTCPINLRWVEGAVTFDDWETDYWEFLDLAGSTRMLYHLSRRPPPSSLDDSLERETAVEEVVLPDDWSDCN